jgi:hypothetical protein
MTPGWQHLLRVAVGAVVAVALTLLLWPLLQSAWVTPLAVAGGVGASSLIEDRVAGHPLHWRAALAAAAVSGTLCFFVLRWLTP